MNPRTALDRIEELLESERASIRKMDADAIERFDKSHDAARLATALDGATCIVIWWPSTGRVCGPASAQDLCPAAYV